MFVLMREYTERCTEVYPSGGEPSKWDQVIDIKVKSSCSDVAKIVIAGIFEVKFTDTGIQDKWQPSSWDNYVVSA